MTKKEFFQKRQETEQSRILENITMTENYITFWEFTGKEVPKKLVNRLEQLKKQLV